MNVVEYFGTQLYNMYAFGILLLILLIEVEFGSFVPFRYGSGILSLDWD